MECGARLLAASANLAWVSSYRHCPATALTTRDSVHSNSFLGFEAAQSFHSLYGPLLMVAFAILSQTLRKQTRPVVVGY